MQSVEWSNKHTIETTLAGIARHYLPGNALVRVMVTDLAVEFLQGRARVLDSGWLLIELDWRSALDGETFFHELAHHVKGHVMKTSKLDAQGVRLSQLNLSTTERDALSKVIDGMEREAEAWALREWRAFERRFGPFDEAVIGEVSLTE